MDRVSALIEASGHVHCMRGESDPGTWALHWGYWVSQGPEYLGAWRERKEVMGQQELIKIRTAWWMTVGYPLVSPNDAPRGGCPDRWSRKFGSLPLLVHP